MLAPYVDALWTPAFWDYGGGRYRWHRGYWGRHIGFYGGINYGFGYTGCGYYGGYWNNGRFAYNRAVTNVNVNVVHNVYERKVTYKTSVNRVSFNGPGGVISRPIPAELAVLRETRTAPVGAQVRHARMAGEDLTQFASVNRGSPALTTQPQPLATNYRAPAARPAPSEQLRPLRQSVPAREGFRPGQPQPCQPRQSQTTERQVPQPVPNARPFPQRQQEANRRVPENRPASPELRQTPNEVQRQERPRPEFGRPAAVPAPAPPVRQLPPPQRQVVPERPAFHPRPAPEARLAPEARPVPEVRQASPPRAAPEVRPAPAARPAAQARPEPPAGRPGEKERR